MRARSPKQSLRPVPRSLGCAGRANWCPAHVGAEPMPEASRPPRKILKSPLTQGEGGTGPR